MHALSDVTLAVDEGDFVAVMGPSGSGKSTFMNVIGCLDRPTSGAYRLDGETVSTLGGDALAAVRNRKIGFVFQQFHLLDRLDAIGNVELPMIYAAQDRAARRDKAVSALARMSGLATASITGRRNCPADSSSASPSRARSSTPRKCCSPTSRPARSTAAPRSS